MTSRHDDFTRANPGSRASADPADRVAYARDLWPRHHLAVRAGNVGAHRPGFVVWPETTEEVSRVVAWAARTGTPVIPFGAGSGVCAGILPTEDALVLDLKRMGRIRAIDPAVPSVDVEAGAMGVPFEEELVRAGFTLGHFPSSILCSTVGGWLAARSAGQCSGKYGKIEDMVISLECVTGTGEIVTLHQRQHGASLVPIVVGSEGTMAVITRANLRVHPAPEVRAYGAFSFPTTERGWDGMRTAFQGGKRPAVMRLYDPFDAMLARQGSVKRAKARGAGSGSGSGSGGPGAGTRALRRGLQSPRFFNALVEGPLSVALGPALVVVIFEGQGARPHEDLADTRRMFESLGGTWEGEGQARKWFQHRYSVSYRQAPVFAKGLFSDTMEVAAPWSRLGDLYHGVRAALGKSVFVMAHLSHAYPDGCCIYFSFAGSASPHPSNPDAEWDERCEEVYDRTWKAAMAAVLAAGGVLAHHHGVGRSKAPRLAEDLGGVGMSTVRALMRAFDPKGILNPGNLVSPPSPDPYRHDASPREISP